MDSSNSTCGDTAQNETVTAAQGGENQDGESSAVAPVSTAGTLSTELNENTASLNAVSIDDPAHKESMLKTSAKPARQSDDWVLVSAGAGPALGPEAGQTPPQSLLSLPIDSLHCVASFLAPADWSTLSLAGHSAHRVCREVFRRVRMHGFRCATEVVTAWVSSIR